MIPEHLLNDCNAAAVEMKAAVDVRNEKREIWQSAHANFLDVSYKDAQSAYELMKGAEAEYYKADKVVKEVTDKLRSLVQSIITPELNCQQMIDAARPLVNVRNIDVGMVPHAIWLATTAKMKAAKNAAERDTLRAEFDPEKMYVSIGVPYHWQRLFVRSYRMDGEEEFQNPA
jgi:hypothetical protein